MRATYIGCIGTHAHCRQMRHIYVKVASSCHYSFEGRIEKSVTQDHRLSSIGMPHDSKQRSLEWIFLSFHHIYDRLLQYSTFSRNFTYLIFMNPLLCMYLQAEWKTLWIPISWLLGRQLIWIYFFHTVCTQIYHVKS